MKNRPTNRPTYPTDLAMNHEPNDRLTDHPAQDESAVSYSDRPTDRIKNEDRRIDQWRGPAPYHPTDWPTDQLSNSKLPACLLSSRLNDQLTGQSSYPRIISCLLEQLADRPCKEWWSSDRSMNRIKILIPQPVQLTDRLINYLTENYLYGSQTDRATERPTYCPTDRPTDRPTHWCTHGPIYRPTDSPNEKTHSF